ncbi:MAG: PQQ-dependent sugar dehydrogenase [Aggregatilineales bacterium]
MKRSVVGVLFVTVLTTLISTRQATVAQASLPLNTITLPAGFKIDLFASGIPDARSMTLGDNDTLFVGSRQAGKVYAITGYPQANHIYILASGLNQPNGVAFRDGSLYVAEQTRIIRFDNIETSLAKPPRFVVVNASFPSQPLHGWKFIKFGPDGKLYVPVGAPCDICQMNLNRYAMIMRMNPDGSGLEVFATGIRNTVGFDWQPDTNILWFTDNGNDKMGDDIPPDELNAAPQAGMNFGFPFCHGSDIVDPQYGAGHSCNEFTPPVQNLGPHVAALGMRFYTGSMFPDTYHNQIFIAEHGSESRSIPIGYRITLVTLDSNGNALSYQPFATGWLQGSRYWGRPVDVQVMPDGALLVSDDYAGAIYRISYAQ